MGGSSSKIQPQRRNSFLPPEGNAASYHPSRPSPPTRRRNNNSNSIISGVRAHTQPSELLEFNLYLVRHGISCANLAKKKGERLLQHTYTDPELTTWGRKKAKALGPYLEASLSDPFFIVGASCLLRAQQTAYYMLEPERLIIVPYISEKGIGGENYAFSPKAQADILEQYTCGDLNFAPKRVWDYFDSAPNASVPSTNKFLAWLKDHYRTLVASNVKDIGTPLVLFSHGIFIRDFIKEQMTRTGLNPFPDVPIHKISEKTLDNLIYNVMKNYTAVRFRVTIDEEASSIKIIEIEIMDYEEDAPKQYTYSKDLNVTSECEVDGCRKRVCESFSSGRFKTRRSQNNICRQAETIRVPADRKLAVIRINTTRKAKEIRGISGVAEEETPLPESDAELAYNITAMSKAAARELNETHTPLPNIGNVRPTRNNLRRTRRANNNNSNNSNNSTEIEPEENENRL